MTKDQVNIVMLIDDNATDRFIHKKLLDIYSIGTSILEFEGGRSALDFLRKEAGKPDELPDLILLDISMPEMNGFDFLKHLERLFDGFAKKPLVFMLSSTDDEGDHRRARKNPLVQKMLKKPFSPETLIKAIGEIG